MLFRSIPADVLKYSLILIHQFRGRTPLEAPQKRTVHPQFPPKVEYGLTKFGKTLCPAMKTLVDWAMTFPKNRETSRYQPRKARKAF
ncbi:MAG: winged helix-turn-helix transcriptional regulator [Terracidiphilus sp.]